jgi:pre-mRNA-splicing factor CWC26
MSQSKLEYLKQNYLLSGGGGGKEEEEEEKKLKKKKKKKTNVTKKNKRKEEGVKVYDEDEDNYNNTNTTKTASEDFEENTPVIVTDAHYVARSKREEEDEKTKKKNANSSNSNSGWVTVVEGAKKEEEEEPRNTASSNDDDDDDNKNNNKKMKMKKKKRRHDSDGEEEEEEEEEEKKKTKKKTKKRRQRHDSDDDDADADAEEKEEPATTNDDVKTEVVEYDSDGDVIVRKVTKTTEAKRSEEPEQKVEYDSDGDIIVKPQPPVKATKNKTGLVSASEIVKEAELRRKEQEERIEKMSAEKSGKNAKTLVRDKTTGRLLTQEEIEERTRGAQETKKEREKPVWGGGLKQQQIENEKAEELRKASEAPFARSEVDATWNSEKMNEVRYGDPMAKKAHERQQKELEKQQKKLNVMQGVDKKLAKKHGFKVPQEIPKHSWRNKAVAVERNRYGIEPGRHWDGVDRGTGFEKKWLQKSELRKHLEIEKRGTRNLTDTVYDEDDFNEDLGT